MKHKQDGFTVVEVLVVVIVISILLSIVTLAYMAVQRQSRDAVRRAHVSQLADALERFYDTFGEYPVCGRVTSSPSSVVHTLSGLDEAALRNPQNNNGNAFSCDGAAATDQTRYQYRGMGCRSTGCSSWVITYQSESEGQVTRHSKQQDP